MSKTQLSYREFVDSHLQLYHGPFVKVTVGVKDYMVSKPLLRSQSPVFTAMFDGDFKEGEEKSAVLEEIEGVVSARSFELLLQWLYTGRFMLDDESPEDQVSALIELARLEDMLGIEGTVEKQVLEQLRSIVIDDLPVYPEPWRDPNINTYQITSRQKHWANLLPRFHSVRLLIGSAEVDTSMRKTFDPLQKPRFDPMGWVI